MSIQFDSVPKPVQADHESSVLDLAFAMDCTSSMSPYIRSAQQNIRTIIEMIVASEKSDIRMALVEYRDHPPQDHSFVTQVHDFTPSITKMKQWLDESRAQGGGDNPEAVADALHAVLKLGWREEATKICVFIADAPPHGLGMPSDSMPDGCPDGLDPIVTANQLAEKGVTVYMVGCEPAIIASRDFFMAVAHMTGGQYVPLSNARHLSQVIIGGAQEEISLQQVMQDVNEEVTAFAAQMSEEELTDRVHHRLKQKGYQSCQLQMNNAALPQVSTAAKDYTRMSSLSAVREEFQKNTSAATPQFAALGLGTVPSSKYRRKGTSNAIVDSAPPALNALSTPAEEPAYSVNRGAIDQCQASRLVQKAMKMNKLK